MSRRFAAGAAVAAAALLPAACATWSDTADAEALAACERLAEPDQRQECRANVAAIAEAKHQAEMDRLGERILEGEERERADRVYGGPTATGRD